MKEILIYEQSSQTLKMVVPRFKRLVLTSDPAMDQPRIHRTPNSRLVSESSLKPLNHPSRDPLRTSGIPLQSTHHLSARPPQQRRLALRLLEIQIGDWGVRKSNWPGSKRAGNPGLIHDWIDGQNQPFKIRNNHFPDLGSF